MIDKLARLGNFLLTSKGGGRTCKCVIFAAIILWVLLPVVFQALRTTSGFWTWQFFHESLASIVTFPQDEPQISVFVVAIFVFFLLMVLGRRYWNSLDENEQRSHESQADMYKPIYFGLFSMYLIGVIISIIHSSSLVSDFDKTINSFISSYWQDLLVFGSLGLLLFYIQTREYRKAESVGNRIRNLFTARDLTPSLFEDIREKIREASVFQEKDELIITLEEYKKGQLRYSNLRRFYVSSLIQTPTQDYFAVYAPKFIFTPDKTLERIYPGQLCYFRYKTVDLEGRVIEANRDLIQNARRLKKSVGLKIPEGELGQIPIPPDRTAIFEERVVYWSIPGEEDITRFARYWSNVDITFNNETSHELELEVQEPSGATRRVAIGKYAREIEIWQAQDVAKGEELRLRHRSIDDEKVVPVR